jgi:hypothetical protein
MKCVRLVQSKTGCSRSPAGRKCPRVRGERGRLRPAGTLVELLGDLFRSSNRATRSFRLLTTGAPQHGAGTTMIEPCSGVNAAAVIADGPRPGKWSHRRAVRRWSTLVGRGRARTRMRREPLGKQDRVCAGCWRGAIRLCGWRCGGGPRFPCWCVRERAAAALRVRGRLGVRRGTRSVFTMVRSGLRDIGVPRFAARIEIRKLTP